MNRLAQLRDILHDSWLASRAYGVPRAEETTRDINQGEKPVDCLRVFHPDLYVLNLSILHLEEMHLFFISEAPIMK